MKNRGFLFIILIAILLICPLAATGGAKAPEKGGNEVTKTNIQDDGDSILVLSSSTKKINEIDMFEYVVGAVAAEMPPAYHSQALRAQAAVCYTYAVKKRSSPDPTLGGADITDDSAVHQGYLDAAARKEKWGDKYETYEKKIEEAVKDVFGKTITYDGEIITAAFHAISCGQTFSAEEIWGKDVPYLKSVTSAGDKLSPDYSSTLTNALEGGSFSITKALYGNNTEADTAFEMTLTLTADAFKKAFAGSGAEFGGDAKKWIGEIKKTDSGYISCTVIGEKEFTGAQVREKLGLRSACFEIKCTDDEFKITVHGYGHGVGMSQYGADYMARQGSDWQEIIKHYYTGVEIK